MKLVVYPNSFKVVAVVFSALIFFHIHISVLHLGKLFLIPLLPTPPTTMQEAFRTCWGGVGYCARPVSLVFPASLRRGAVVIPLADEECEGLGGDCPKSLQPESRDTEQILISWSLV